MQITKLIEVLDFLFYRLKIKLIQMLYYAGCYITKIEIKDYNFLINERNVFDQFVKNDLRAYGNIQKNSN